MGKSDPIAYAGIERGKFVCERQVIPYALDLSQREREKS
jgi:hypothetical protein